MRNAYMKRRLDAWVALGRISQREADKIHRFHEYHGEMSIEFQKGVIEQLDYRLAGAEWFADFAERNPQVIP